MVGMGVTELINNFALVKEAEIIQENIENTIFPHPTLSEAIHESVLKASDRGFRLERTWSQFGWTIYKDEAEVLERRGDLDS